MANYRDITLALSGVCQTAALVQQFARDGSGSSEALRVSLQSLLITQPENTLAVFGGREQHLKLGIETLLAQLHLNSRGEQGKQDLQMSRYWIGILALSRKLDKNPQAKNALAQRLTQLQRQLPLYQDDILAEQMLENIASIYSDIISPLGAKIQVYGQQHLLQRRDIQNRIRALLLAGVRAGILWQQVGGSRWQLLFSRKKIIHQANSLHQSLPNGDF